MKRREPINFGWKYKADFREEYLSPAYDDTDFDNVEIPHSNIEIPYNYFDEKIYQFESCYRRKLHIDSLKRDERVYIHFEGIMTYARVFLNGVFLGEHKGGYTGFRIDLTDALNTDGPDILAVYVDSTERSDIPPFGHVVDYLTYGGIYRETALEYCHELHLEHGLIKPDNVLTETPAVDMDLYFRNDSGRAQSGEMEFIITCRGEEFFRTGERLTFTGKKEQKQVCSFQVPVPQLWDIDNPVLYEMETLLTMDGEIRDSRTFRFGFRQVDYRKDGFRLNGKLIKLLGLNRHQSYPYTGYAMPRSAQYDDAEILKYQLGVNTVRLSHYPQSRHFLDRCDELGLLVFDEIPGWQHIGDESWQALSLQNVRDMILTDGNHPSVFIWGVRVNESQDNDDFYRKTNELARKLDATRPTGGVRCIAESSMLEDVFTFNDFSHTGENSGLIPPSRTSGKAKPYLVTEHNGHMYPTKKFDDEAHLFSQAKRHLAVLETMYSREDISGSIGWSMFDYNTHKDFGSGDKICYHGVMDMFRLPKLAASVYASQQDDSPVLEISSSMNIGEREGSLLGDIYIFTNCDYIRMYKNGVLIRDFHPRRDLYPSLPHPPVIIDDFIGDAIEKNESFSSRDALAIKELMLKISREGLDLGIRDKIRMGWLLFKNRMNTKEAEDLYTKYFAGWGGEATTFSFTGYKDGQPVKTVVRDQNSPVSLKLKADRETLHEGETWDCLRCTVHLEDEYANAVRYAHESITLETEGPVGIIGPKVLPLTGGSTGFWVRTAGAAGTGTIRLKSERFGVIKKEIRITKN
ncbi:glycoside hydrolase family 2 protein [Spirochaeta isovalerica]|uniref:Beta-galactosidase n=1 Tax=Spirochaeta isovalerica TaxID=150 RepID=A0A841REI4_9SPIO|nr:glycoside hydrolase family 2 TIM barrel-domain containing protein [Spirochaeta isovalerica]MBB6481249.1 beta-galactosidase [Spirochaeta isovalerica]